MASPEPVAVGSAVPVGARLDETHLLRFQLELERESNAAVSRLSQKFQALENRESQRFRSSLEHTVQQAQSRVADTARTAVDKQVGPALRSHLENSAAATEAVQEVCLRLETRASENAEAVVRRLAGEAAITQAIEAKCLARLDEKTRSLWWWAAVVPFVSASAAVYLTRWWDTRGK